MEDVTPSLEDVALPLEDTPFIIDAQSLIEEVNDIPSGFQFPQDWVRVEHMARLLEEFGQDLLLELSECAAINGTSIIWEAFQQDMHTNFGEEFAGIAAGKPVPDDDIEEEIL
ncbi:MAG: hypothetical protein ASARMPREDX12_001778 [Alectoria sarmentosa]|nr:MAG: hypothetical protein ASARMPREDX12_001778 [Alectoria sarmentosa]